MNRPRISFCALGAVAVCLVLSAPVAQAGEEHQCPEPLDHCIRTMIRKMEYRGWVGIEMERNEGQAYLVIRRVIPESPAAAAGLKPGDVLTGLNGIPYDTPDKEKLEATYQREMNIGNTITYNILRDGRRVDVRIHLARIPEPVRAQMIGNHVLQYHGADPSRMAESNKP